MSVSLQSAIRALSSNTHLTWRATCREWRLSHYRYQALPTNCICGVQIHHLYYIRNTLTQNIALVGSECIHQFQGEVLTEARAQRNAALPELWKEELLTEGHTFVLTFLGIDQYGKLNFRARVEARLHQTLSLVNSGASKLWINERRSVRRLRILAKNRLVADSLQLTDLLEGQKYRVRLHLKDWNFSGRSGTLLEVLNIQVIGAANEAED